MHRTPAGGAPAGASTSYVYVQIRGSHHAPPIARPGRAQCEDALCVPGCDFAQVTGDRPQSGGGRVSGWVGACVADGHSDPVATRAALGARIAVGVIAHNPGLDGWELTRQWRRCIMATVGFDDRRRGRGAHQPWFDRCGTTAAWLTRCGAALRVYRVGDAVALLVPASGPGRWLWPFPKASGETASLADPTVRAEVTRCAATTIMLGTDGLLNGRNDRETLATTYAQLARWALEDPTHRHATLADVLATDVRPTDDLSVIMLTHQGVPTRQPAAGIP